MNLRLICFQKSHSVLIPGLNDYWGIEREETLGGPTASARLSESMLSDTRFH